MSIHLDLAANTFSGFPVLELYDDRNNNGVIDAPEELVSDNVDEGFETKTDSDKGDKFVIVRVNLSCPYRGTLGAFIEGGVFNSIGISVEER